MTSTIIKLKENSHKLVLDTIRKQKSISGAELSRITKLQPSSILYILRALKNNNLIKQSGKGISTDKGGKKPTLWKLNEKNGILIGLEVLPERIISSYTNFEGNIIDQKEEAFQKFISENEMLKAILKVITNICEKNNNLNAIGVGIAITGIVDGIKGELIYSNKMQFKNVMIKDYIEQNTHLPTFVINGANAGALQVQWFNNNITNNIVYLTYSEDVLNLGAGLIINKNLYEGASGTSGEMFGKLPVLEDLYAKAIHNIKSNEPLLIEIDKGQSKLSSSLINEFYRKNCKISEYILQSLSSFIAKELIWIIGFVNPELIVIGGDLESNSDLIDRFILPEITKFIKDNDYKNYIIPKIKFSKYGKYSISMGGIALIWKQILQYNI